MKKITSYILGFILSICLVILTVLIALNIVFSEKHFQKIIDKNNYKDATYKSIISGFENIIMPLDIELDIEQIITKDLVNSDLDNLTKSIFHNEEIKLNTESIKDSFLELEKNNITTEEEETAFNELASKLESVYESEILYSKSTIKDISNYLNIIKDLIKVLVVVLGLIIINLSTIMIYLLKETKILNASFMASGLIIFIIKFLIGNSYLSILIINKHFTTFVIELINNFINLNVIFAVVFIITGLAIRIYSILKSSHIKISNKSLNF